MIIVLIAILIGLIVIMRSRYMSTVWCQLLGHDTGGCCMQNGQTGLCWSICSRCNETVTGQLGDFVKSNIRGNERVGKEW